MGLDVFEVNETMTRAARQAVGDHVFVAGSVGPTGKMIHPLGDISFRGLVDVFKEQIRGLVAGGADLILGETHFDLAEAQGRGRGRARSLRPACRHQHDLRRRGQPDRDHPEVFAQTMENMGVDLIGSNCSAGPEELIEVASAMLSRQRHPLCSSSPTRDCPNWWSGATVFRLAPDPFAATVSNPGRRGRVLSGRMLRHHAGAYQAP
jgi:5-methyltetrahydrofolate--homocysteine methyltransferase